MKLSTSRWLTIALGALCLLLAVFAVLQRSFAIGSGFSYLPVPPATLDEAITRPLLVSTHALPPDGQYLEINDRALFTQTRTAPTKQMPVVAETKPVLPVVPLDAVLTGIVLTPNRKIALLRRGEQSFRLREGMPFPGELAGWRVSQIQPRSVIFEGTTGSQELKLDVSNAPTAPAPMFTPQPGVAPVASRPPVAAAPPAFNDPTGKGLPQQVPAPGTYTPPPPPPPNADQAAREAEVQRIIEERRAQMRAEEERRNATPPQK